MTEILDREVIAKRFFDKVRSASEHYEGKDDETKDAFRGLAEEAIAIATEHANERIGEVLAGIAAAKGVSLDD